MSVKNPEAQPVRPAFRGGQGRSESDLITAARVLASMFIILGICALAGGVVVCLKIFGS